jgi:hypothetical protein
MDDFYNFVNYVEMVDEYFDEFGVEQMPRKYIRIEDPFEKYNDYTFLKRYRFPKLIVMDQLVDLLGIQVNHRGLPITPIQVIDNITILYNSKLLTYLILICKNYC